MYTFKNRVVFIVLILLTIWCLFLIRINYNTVNNNFRYNSNNVTIPQPPKYNYTFCETIHVGIVCTGYEQHLKLYVMLKSIYFHRSQPIHFHIMVDDESIQVLDTLFKTWNVPQVEVTYYNETTYKSDLHWEENDKYLYKKGFIKLLLSSAISLSLTKKLIVLDTDLVFSADIYELWSFFDNFTDNQIVGLPEIKIKQLLNDRIKPRLITKFDTGVTLHHLEHQKNLNWYSRWTKVARYIIRDQLHEAEDILNNIFKPNSSLVYLIPCEWNIRFSYVNRNCYLNNKIKVVHRNYLQNGIKTHLNENSFLALHSMFFKYNGNLLKFKLPQCPSNETNIKLNSIHKCSIFEKDITLNRRTLQRVKYFNYSPSDNDVTLSTQLSFDKLKLTEKISENWNGPISFTIYTTDKELEKTLKFIENSPFLSKRTNIIWNAMFKEGNHYPINDLRNVSLRSVVTPYVFLMDMDLMPTNTLYEELKTLLERIDSMDSKALVVPAFESRSAAPLPVNKEEVLSMVKNKTLKIFHPEFIKAYGPTDYERWYRSETTYNIKYELYFEPYVVVKADVVEYDRRFIGFGFNKAAHIMNLDAQGYEFVVVPDLFIIHQYHRPSQSVKENSMSFIYRKCKYSRMRAFANELNRKYNTTYAIRSKIK